MSTPTKAAAYAAVQKYTEATFRILHDPGQVFEVRALNVPKSSGFMVHYGGYFDDPVKASHAAAGFSGRAQGVYTTLNLVDPSLLSRCANRMQELGRGLSATSDRDIIQRRWLLVDCDAQRASGISATEAELDAALKRRDEIKRFLAARGFPEPIVLDSGNGGHLLYGIDLNGDDDIVKSFLESLSSVFPADLVKVDDSVWNAGQITKAYGTMACKGDSTVDRPHRYSEIIHAPCKLEIAPRELLEQFVRDFSSAARTASTPPPVSGTFELEEWLAMHLPSVRAPKPWQGGRNWVIPVCPFNDTHSKGEAYVAQLPSGAISAGCHHQTCKWNWQELRAKYDKRAVVGYKQSSTGARGHLVKISDVMATRLEHLWYFPLGKFSILEGDPDVGKSSVLLDIASRITTGAPMPFESHRGAPGSVIILASEDGVADTIKPRMIAAGADVTKAHVFTVQHDGVDGLATFPEHVPLLEEMVARTGAVLVILDPLISHFGVDTYKDAQVRRALAPLQEMAERLNVALVGIRHLTKADGGKAMYRGGGSIAFTAAARAVFVAGKDPGAPDEFRVLASVKSNLSKPPASVRYKLVSQDESHKVQWVEKAPGISADDLVQQIKRNDDDDATPTEDAADWLRGVLKDEEMKKADVLSAGRQEGFGERVLRRARKKLDVVVRRAGTGKGHTSYWSLPPGSAPLPTPALPDMGVGVASHANPGADRHLKLLPLSPQGHLGPPSTLSPVGPECMAPKVPR